MGTTMEKRSGGRRARPGGTPCPLDAALQLLTGAWTMQVVWYLRDEPRRFACLKRDLGAVSAKVLAGRLRELERKGVVSRTVKPTAPPAVEYALTPLGAKLRPVVRAIHDVAGDLDRSSRSTASRG